MCKQEIRALAQADRWNVGAKRHGKRIKRKAMRRAGKAFCRDY